MNRLTPAVAALLLMAPAANTGQPSNYQPVVPSYQPAPTSLAPDANRYAPSTPSGTPVGCSQAARC